MTSREPAGEPCPAAAGGEPHVFGTTVAVMQPPSVPGGKPSVLAVYHCQWCLLPLVRGLDF